MKKQPLNLILFVTMQLFFVHSAFAQLDSIFVQGVWRTFIVHLPTGYTSSNQYPLVVNLHGLNSNAAQQETYSQFNNVADTYGFIVVYPNGISNQWNVSGDTDVNFISHLIDIIRNKYSCNTFLFATGISEGGFMTYKLACALPYPLTAIAVVAGNMSKTLQNNCAVVSGLPVMHFHGTADGIVNYNGVFPVIPPVDTTIQWWVNKNICNTTPVFTSLPDTNSGDSCTAEKYYYDGGANGSEVIFYKIINGGHTWPGATPKPLLGNTNQDINASALIGSFFQQFCSSPLGLNEFENEISVSIFPNPARNIFTIDLPQQNFTLEIFDVTGRKVYSNNIRYSKTQIDFNNFPNGLYFIQIYDSKNIFTQKIIISH